MKRIASLCMTSGVLMMIVTLAAAAMTMQRTSADEMVSTENACLNCHEDAHIEWYISGDIDTLTLEDDTEAFCVACHTTDDDLLDSLTNVEGRINTLQQRTDTLHADLDRVYASHPDWDVDTDYLHKSRDQRTAERIATLVDYVEADGSWGFHDAEYTDRLLSEAEFLMIQLLDALVEEDR